MATREGAIDHKDGGQSPWWNVQKGDVHMRDPSGKFDVFANAQVRCFENTRECVLVLENVFSF